MTQAATLEANKFYRDLTRAGMSARKAEVLAVYQDKFARVKKPAKLRALKREYIEAMLRVGFPEPQAKIIAEMRAATAHAMPKRPWYDFLFAKRKRRMTAAKLRRPPATANPSTEAST